MDSQLSRILIYLYCLTGAVVLAGQSNARLDIRVDSTHMTIGDYNRATLILSNAGSVNPQWVSTLPDTTQNIELIREEPWTTTTQGTSKGIIFSVYDTGFIWLPPQMVVIGSDTLLSESLPLEVSGVPIDSSGLAPIKDIITEPLSWRDFLPGILIVLGLMMVFALAFWWLKRKKRPVVVPPVTPPQPPYDVALQKLNALEQDAAWQKGEIKRFQSELTFIVREYLENQFQLPALERTSAEIIRDASQKQLPEVWIKSLKELLTTADFVKFAKAQPPVDIHPRLLAQARQLVLDTQQFIQPKEPDFQTQTNA